MKFLDSVIYILQELFGKKGAAPAPTPVATPEPPPPAAPAAPANGLPTYREDRDLTDNFGLHELTGTSRTAHLRRNRIMTNKEENKLQEVAKLLEQCRSLEGGPLEVHSGRRYPLLNTAIGGSRRSQHMRCEAADFSPLGPDTEESMRRLFNKIWEAGKRGDLKFGQLILETDKKRDYARVWWIHISLGQPYRGVARCGEVLEMKDGNYKVVGKVAA